MYRRALPLFALLAPLAADAAPPPLVPVTGYLTDSTGAPVNDQVTLHLKMYATANGTVSEWEEAQTVDVDNGQFTAYLGQSTPLDLVVFNDNPALFLGMAIDNGAEMTPRFVVATAPYAGYAQYCDDAATVGGIDPLDLRLTTDKVAWSDLQGTPAGLNDGDQDTLYTAGSGLSLSTGNQFSADQPTIEGWAKLAAYDSVTELRLDLDSVYATKSSLAAVATSGAYVDLTGKPTLAPIATTGSYADLTGKPTLATVATTGAYADLTGKPALATVATSGAYADLTGKPTLAAVATTGSYADLASKPDLTVYAAASALAALTTRVTTAEANVATLQAAQTALPNIPGLTVWVKADTGVTLSSGTVSRWADQSGNGNDFVMATASRQPVVDASAINGLPALKMVAAASQTMTMPKNVPAPATVIYVGRMTGAANSRVLSGLNNNWLLGYHGGTEMDYHFNAWNYDSSIPATTNWYIWSAVMSGNTSAAYRSGLLINWATAGIEGPNGLSLSGHLAGSEFSNCEIAEVLVYNRALSEADVLAIERYLSIRYAL